MIFNKLIITNFEKESIYNEYKFNSVGLNLIFGQKSLENDETNGVGKTALIECIKYCLGSSLPDCFKGKINLVKNNIFVILELTYGKKKLKIGRFLFDDSFAYITENEDILFTLSLWDLYTKDDFRTYIEKIAYDFLVENDSIVPPSFSSVKEYLIRDEKSGFQDLSLSNRSAVSFNQINSFLSLLPNNFESNLNLQKKVIKDLQNELNIIKEIGKEIKNVKQMHSETINEVKQLKRMLENADVSSKITYDEEKYYILKESLSLVQQKIHQLEYAKSQHEKNIEGLEENLKKMNEFINIKDFYKQVLDYFPEKLSKNYDEMIDFHNFMVENRGSYFRKQIEIIDGKLEPLYIKHKEYLKGISDCTALVKNSDLVIDLRDISNQINEKYKSIAEYEFKIEKYKTKKSIEGKIKNQKQVLEEMTEKYESMFNEYENNINNIIDHFYELNMVTYGEKGVLEYTFESNLQARANTGRIKIMCSLPDEGAHGRFLMKINMFDIALLMNRVDKTEGLLFLFHDGSYSKPAPSVKGPVLIYIDKYLKEAGKGQYFITINTEELNTEDLKALKKQRTVVAELERTEDNLKRSIGIKY